MRSSARVRIPSRGMLACLMALVLLLMLPATSLARDYSIDRVDIDATVRADGSVKVHEERTFDFDGEFHGVYWKIPAGTYNGRRIDVDVISVGEMVGGQYVEFKQSDSEANHTYQLSSYGSGIRIKLFSAHEDEDATFVIDLDETNLAARYDDVSELYWKFVSDGWDVESKNVTCRVHLPVPAGKKVEPEENVRAWGHGPLDANVHFDGNDVLYTVPGVGTSEFAEARITFPAEWLSDASSQGGAKLQSILSEERAWAEEANAKRERARKMTYGGGALAGLGTIASLIACVWVRRRYDREHKAQFDDKYFRDVPTDDHPAVLGAFYRGGDPAGEDFTATLMRLTDMGAITMEPERVETKGLFGRTKTSDDYRLSVTPRAADMKLDNIDRKALKTLFLDIGRRAPSNKGRTGDAVDQTLLFSDLEKVAKKHPEAFHNSMEGWNAQVESGIAKCGYLKSDTPTGRWIAGLAVAAIIALGMGTVFLLVMTEAWQMCIGLLVVELVALLFAISTLGSLESISKEGLEVRAKLEGLENWLKDFTRLEEAVPRDVILWNRLLVMAVALGVADKVIKQLEVTMPELLQDPAIMPTYYWYSMGPRGRAYEAFNTSYADAHHVSSAALAASEASSGGGGGGGFSGGGGGGFGGGGGGGAF